MEAWAKLRKDTGREGFLVSQRLGRMDEHQNGTLVWESVWYCGTNLCINWVCSEQGNKYPAPGSEIVVKRRSVKRNAKNARGLGRDIFLAATAPFPSRVCLISEIKIHRKLQTSDSSWKFLRIENKQIKTVPNDSYGYIWHKTTYFCVEAIETKRRISGKLGHVVQIHVCRLA